MLDNRIAKGLVEIAKSLNQIYIELEGHTYKVLTEYEIQEEFQQFQIDLFDDLGLDAYSMWAQDYIIDNFVFTDWFDDLQYNIVSEDFDTMDEEEQMEIAESFDVKDLDKARDLYIEQMLEEDSVEWYRDAVGERDFKDVLIKYNLIDFEEVMDYILEEDGYTCLASYDGNIESCYDEETHMTYYVYILV